MYNPLKTAFTICVSYQIIEFYLYVYMCGLCNLLIVSFFSDRTDWLVDFVCV